MGDAGDQIIRMLELHSPDYLISLGEASRDAICIEQAGYNFRDFRIPDNEGNLPAPDLITSGASS
jgi:pyrrolidone-carboxylate peptidase